MKDYQLLLFFSENHSPQKVNSQNALQTMRCNCISFRNAPPPYSENGVLRRVSTTSPPPVYNSLNSRINPQAPSAPPEELSAERLENSESQNLESPRWIFWSFFSSFWKIFFVFFEISETSLEVSVILLKFLACFWSF